MRRSFTLIEMLVVVAIIIVIAGVILPVLGKVREYSWRTRARDSVYQIKTAWLGYLTDYREFPDFGGVRITQMDSNACKALWSSTLNPKKYTYMEFTTNEIIRGFIDPWKTNFQLALDNGVAQPNGWDPTPAYDSQIAPPHFTGGARLKQNVGVWCMGQNNGLAGKPNQTNDDILGW